MKTIVNTAILVSILLTLLLIIRRENESLNSKISELNGMETQRIEEIKPDVRDEVTFTR